MIHVLVAVLVVVGLCTVLTLVLVVAEALLVNYGECTLTINGEDERIVEGGRTLLASLMEKEIFVPSACGGRGSCGLCKVKVLEGGGPLLPTEAPHLTAEETKDHVRLACQVKVRSDMALEIPEGILSLRQYTTTVERILQLSQDTKLIRLALVDPPEMSFRPGQYIQWETPAYGKTPEPVYRAYSIASAVTEKNALELIIRFMPGGICTTYIFELLSEGDSVRINGPYGEFYLRDTDREVVFIAGGTGLAPVRSILYQMAEEQIGRRATFFYGANKPEDLYLQDELRGFHDRIPDFTYVPTLAQPGDGWDGETGLVTAALDRRIQRADTQEFYLCGSPAMIDACVELLRGKGATDDRVFYDKFDSK
jgi:Na+-transporting NADH:ubiquinone oxidoreductase subunit F